MENFVKKYGISLSNQQYEVISDTKHPMYIKGESGSGKTHSFIARVAYLINMEQIPAQHILNLCADEETCTHVAQQYEHKFLEENHQPVFITMQEFACQILQRAQDSIVQNWLRSDREQDEVIAKVALDNFSVLLRKHQLQMLRNQISYVRHHMLDASDLDLGKVEGIEFAAFFKVYTDFKQKKKMMDCDDLLFRAYQVLEENEVIRKELQHFYHFIQVDDAQDLSNLTYKLITMLAREENPLVLFANKATAHTQRGASLVTLDCFQQQFPTAVCYEWQDNYVANKTCVETVNRFLYEEQEVLQTSSEVEEEIGCKGFVDTTRLYAYAKKQGMQEEGSSFVYKDIAFALPLVDDFDVQGISYGIQGNFDRFYQDVIIQELLDYVTLIIDSKDVDSFACMYSSMNFDISEKIAREVIAMLREDANMDIFEALVRSSMKIIRRKELSAQMELIRILPEKESYAILKSIITKLGYDKRLKKLHVAKRDPYLIVLNTMALRYPNPHEFVNRMRNLSVLRLSRHGLMQLLPVDQVQNSLSNTIYVLDCMEGYFPTRTENALIKQDERQMFARCMAHAAHLELFAFKSVSELRCEISSFIFEVHKKKGKEEESKTIVRTGKIRKISETHLKVNTRISHKTLGDGVIKKAKDGMIEVHFDSQEVKNLNIKYCLNNEMINLI